MNRTANSHSDSRTAHSSRGSWLPDTTGGRSTAHLGLRRPHTVLEYPLLNERLWEQPLTRDTDTGNAALAHQVVDLTLLDPQVVGHLFGGHELPHVAITLPIPPYPPYPGTGSFTCKPFEASHQDAGNISFNHLAHEQMWDQWYASLPNDHAEESSMALIQVLDASFERLIDPNAPVQNIATGFAFTEGPVWNSRDQRLIFSDIPNDTMYVWTEADDHKVFRHPSGQGNGNTFDRQGRLLTCEHANRRVSRTAARWQHRNARQPLRWQTPQ